MATVHRWVLLLMAFLLRLLGKPAAAQAPRPNKQFINKKSSVESWIYQGQDVFAYMQERYGDEKARQMMCSVAQRANGSKQSVSGGSQPSGAADPHDAEADDAADDESDEAGGATRKKPSLPYRFWRRYIEDVLHQTYTPRKKMELFRSLTWFAQRQAAGASTPAAMRDLRKTNSSRGSGGSMNARKAAGLGFALLQYFVDHVQRLMSRADSCMLMEQAREMHNTLVAEGTPVEDLPKLEGCAGRMLSLIHI